MVIEDYSTFSYSIYSIGSLYSRQLGPRRLYVDKGEDEGAIKARPIEATLQFQYLDFT